MKSIIVISIVHVFFSLETNLFWNRNVRSNEIKSFSRNLALHTTTYDNCI